MNGKNLFRALEYVDDRYLDMVDAAAQEATDMKQKHFSGKKAILYILAAAICVSLFTVTAAAAGWIPNIFAAAQPKATPRDEPVLEAAQSATQSQTPETVEFAEADYTKFTLFQSYYDGKSIALGYDLSGVMPGETVVGFTPEDTLKQEILQRPDNQFWCERYGLTDDTVDQYLEAGVWTREEYDQRLAGRSEYAKKYDLRREFPDLHGRPTARASHRRGIRRILGNSRGNGLVLRGHPDETLRRRPHSSERRG